MSYFEKEKNLYKFYIDGKSKPYVFDVNTGLLYGLRGAPLQTMPTAIPKLLGDTHRSPNGNLTSVLRMLLNGESFDGRTAELYRLADRFDSIGYTATVWELRKLKDNLDIVVFKDVASFVKDKKGDIEDYIAEVKRAHFAKTTGLKVDEHFTQAMYDFLYNNYSNADPKALRVMAYWLSRGVWEYYDGDRYALRRRLNDTLAYAQALKWEWEKGDFFRTHINLCREYFARKDELQNEQICAQQNAHRTALEFSTDDYEVVIPMTAEELRVEGRNQNNCVGGYAEAITSGRCNVVFVRKKDNPAQSYITCEVSRYGDICQFYLSYNRPIRDEADFTFKALYQMHIKANWAK